MRTDCWWKRISYIQGPYASLNINFQTFNRLYFSSAKYYQNVCQKIGSGKLFSFSILTGHILSPHISTLENAPTFSMLFKTRQEPCAFVKKQTVCSVRDTRPGQWQSNGCSTHAPRYSAAKQSIEGARSYNEDSAKMGGSDVKTLAAVRDTPLL